MRVTTPDISYTGDDDDDEELEGKRCVDLDLGKFACTARDAPDRTQRSGMYQLWPHMDHPTT